MDKQKLTELLSNATLEAWCSFKEEQAKSGIYVFGLYTCGEGLYAFASGNTESALSESGNNAWQVKWSPCDWKHHGYKEDIFNTVEDFLSAGWNEDYSEYAYEAEEVFECCHNALRALVESDKFQNFEGREKVCVGLFQGDQDDEEREKFMIEKGSYPN